MPSVVMPTSKVGHMEAPVEHSWDILHIIYIYIYITYRIYIYMYITDILHIYIYTTYIIHVYKYICMYIVYHGHGC